MLKKNILFLALFLFAFSSVILVGGTIPYFIFYVILFSFLLPLVHTLISLRKIKGLINIPSGSLYKDEDININYNVENTGFLSIPYLEIENQISKELTRRETKKTIISLDKDENYTKRETIHLDRRGYYDLVAIKVKIKDVFGIYSFKKTISNASSLLVYPKTIELSNFNLISSHIPGELLVRDSTFKDTSSIESFRDYRPGDSIKSIHWKLTGKADSPIVKEYENSGDINTAILLDNSSKNFKDDIDRRLEDKSVDTALSIVTYCLSQNLNISIETQDIKKQIKIKGEEDGDLKPFLEMFARLKGNGYHDFESLISNKIDFLSENSTLILISPSLTKEIGSKIMEIKMKSINIIFILISDITKKTGKLDLDVEKRLHQESIPLYIIDYNSSIKDVLEAHHE